MIKKHSDGEERTCQLGVGQQKRGELIVWIFKHEKRQQGHDVHVSCRQNEKKTFTLEKYFSHAQLLRDGIEKRKDAIRHEEKQ